MRDLHEKSDGGRNMIRKIEKMHQLFGTTPGEKCKSKVGRWVLSDNE